MHVRLVAQLLPMAFKLGWSELAQGRMDALVHGHLVEKASELLFDSSIIPIFSFVYWLYWLLRASVRKIINFIFRHPVFLCLVVLILKIAGKCFKSLGFAFLMLR